MPDKVIAYLEFYLPKKLGDPIKGIYRITDQDKNNILIKDCEVEILVPRECIKVYEEDLKRWPKWVNK